MAVWSHRRLASRCRVRGTAGGPVGSEWKLSSGPPHVALRRPARQTSCSSGVPSRRRPGVAARKRLLYSCCLGVVEARPFPALDLHDSRLVDGDFDRAEAQPIHRREDLPCDLGGEPNAVTPRRRVGAQGVGSTRRFAHADRSDLWVAAAPLVVTSGPMTIFPTSMTTILTGHYRLSWLMMQISDTYRVRLAH
jgi:hypothetical protein